MQVYRLRLLGDYHHSTRIAFVEFVMVIAFFPLYSSSVVVMSNIEKFRKRIEIMKGRLCQHLLDVHMPNMCLRCVRHS